MNNEQLTMENGELRMENGEWTIENGERERGRMRYAPTDGGLKMD